ncbi:hypothetical protein H8356DRAFT_1325548 [Neocallimastix lanati (nom. inval.)]|nr:hypothetical protein H8356DRAFT_1325548 [Neocallimastix sp. JGI-2020a]
MSKKNKLEFLIMIKITHYINLRKTNKIKHNRKKLKKTKKYKILDKKELLSQRQYVSDFIQNNLKYNNIPNIQRKYNRMVIPIMKWRHCNSNSIIKLSTKWVYK